MIILPLITGMVIKLYDDVNDNKLLKRYKSKFLTEVLKGLSIISLTLVSTCDPLFIYLLYPIICFNYLLDPHAFDKEYEKSLFVIFLFLFLFLDNSKLKFFKITITNSILLFLSFALWCLDYVLFKEEYSINKLIMRTLCIISSITIYFYFISISKAISYIILGIMGYHIISVIVQYYSVFIHDHTKGVKKVKKVKKCKKV